MDTLKLNKKNVLMIAHRGLSGLEKENTMASFIAGGCRSYYGMECDIHPTLDKEFVVVHDSNLERVAGVDLVVEEHLYKDVANVRLIDNFDKTPHDHLVVPKFSEYLSCCKKYGKVAVIEFKEHFSDEDLRKSIDLVKEFDYLDKSIFISFDYTNIVRVRQMDKSINVQQLMDHFKPEYVDLCAQYRADLDIHYKAVTKEVVDLIHSKGLKVNVWTVDTIEDGERMVEYGVDYITSNILE